MILAVEIQSADRHPLASESFVNSVFRGGAGTHQPSTAASIARLNQPCQWLSFKCKRPADAARRGMEIRGREPGELGPAKALTLISVWDP